MSEAQKAEALRLRAMGLSWQTIGGRLGVSGPKLRYHLVPGVRERAREQYFRTDRAKRAAANRETEKEIETIPVTITPPKVDRRRVDPAIKKARALERYERMMDMRRAKRSGSLIAADAEELAAVGEKLFAINRAAAKANG